MQPSDQEPGEEPASQTPADSEPQGSATPAGDDAQQSEGDEPAEA